MRTCIDDGALYQHLLQHHHAGHCSLLGHRVGAIVLKGSLGSAQVLSSGTGEIYLAGVTKEIVVDASGTGVVLVNSSTGTKLMVICFTSSWTKCSAQQCMPSKSMHNMISCIPVNIGKMHLPFSQACEKRRSQHWEACHCEDTCVGMVWSRLNELCVLQTHSASQAWPAALLPCTTTGESAASRSASARVA